jgi:hypothetical protein
MLDDYLFFHFQNVRHSSSIIFVKKEYTKSPFFALKMAGFKVPLGGRFWVSPDNSPETGELKWS